MAEPAVVQKNRAHCVGRRKESVARVYLEEGEGEITVNGKPGIDYFQPLPFTEKVLNTVLLKPFVVTNSQNNYNVEAQVEGGGYKGQLEALQHGIARALTAFDENYKPALKEYDLLTRDPRMVERKKYGRHKARRGQQFSKR